LDILTTTEKAGVETNAVALRGGAGALRKCAILFAAESVSHKN